jgi:SAM-dependent methyltransferase
VTSPYDAFAWFFDRYWAPPFEHWQRPALDHLLFPYVKPQGCILDLCCGTGTLAQALVARGYHIVGIDSSDGMLRIARHKVPEGVFLTADAANFALETKVDAAVSGFDSLNHLLQAEQLESAFRNVYTALQPGGCFVFDLNISDAYGERWDQTFCGVEPDHAFFMRGGYDREARIGHTKITMFRLAGSWERADVAMQQRPWDIPEVTEMLKAVGFQDVCAYRAIEDLNMPGHYGIGRAYFRGSKSSS